MQIVQKALRNWTKPRIYYWISRLLSPLLGRKVSCHICNKSFGKIIPFAVGNRVALLGLQAHSIRYVPCGVSELKFECIHHLSSSQTSITHRDEEVSDHCLADNARVLHVYLAHQTAPYVEKYAKHHQPLLASNDGSLLVYGGSRENFDSIAVDRKVFCSDPRLRGIGYFQSYSGMLADVWKWCLQHGETWDYIFFTESDHWSFAPKFTKLIPGLLLKNKADFAMHELVDIKFSNNWFLSNAIEKDHFNERLEKIAQAAGIQYRHALGTGLCMKWKVLEDFCTLSNDEVACFLEIYLPSVMATRGWKGLSITDASDYYSYVRYRPLFARNEFETLQRKGAPFIHPFKELI